MVRVNKPKLVIPALAHERIFADGMGLTTARTVGKRTIDLAREKQQGGKPSLLTGDWSDGSAGKNLGALLHGQGVIVDATQPGTPVSDVLAYEGFSLYTSLTADVASTSDTVNWSDIINWNFTIATGRSYRVWVMCEASFTNSGGAINTLRILEPPVLTLASGGPTTTTDRERYALGTTVIRGEGTWNWIFQYRPNANTATARAPWFLMLLERLR